MPSNPGVVELNKASKKDPDLVSIFLVEWAEMLKVEFTKQFMQT